MNKEATLVDPLNVLDEAGEYAPIWAPEKPDTIRGTIRRYTDTELEKSGHTWIAIIQDSPESVKSVFLSPTVLKSEFAKLKPKVGERIVIRFLGVPKGKSYKKYSVTMPDRPDAASVPDWNELDPDQANFNVSTPDARTGPYATATIDGPQGGRRTVEVPLPVVHKGGVAVAERSQQMASPVEEDAEEDPFLTA